MRADGEGLMSYLSRTIAIAACAVASSLLHVEPAVSGSAIPGSGRNSASGSSWVAGAHAGYTWQQGAAVFGFETDLQGMNLKSSMSGGLVYPFLVIPTATDAARTSSTIDWYGTVRGQIGVANGPFMFYATGGLAYGRVTLDSYFNTLGVSVASQAAETKVGWVGGVGVNYLLQPNVVLNLQYQYVDLGSLSVAGSTRSTFLNVSQQATASAQFQAVMAGISWKFTPGTGPMPWTGGYAGVHGGGAWGNDTNARYDAASIGASDARLKRDIALIGRRGDGLGIYAYKYLWSDAVYVGVMAQEVALIHPGAVVRDELTGYMAVNYGMLNGN